MYRLPEGTADASLSEVLKMLTMSSLMRETDVTGHASGTSYVVADDTDVPRRDGRCSFHAQVYDRLPLFAGLGPRCMQPTNGLVCMLCNDSSLIAFWGSSGRSVLRLFSL